MNAGAVKRVQRDVDARLPHLEVAVVLCCVQLSLCVCVGSVVATSLVVCFRANKSQCDCIKGGRFWE